MDYPATANAEPTFLGERVNPRFAEITTVTYCTLYTGNSSVHPHELFGRDDERLALHQCTTGACIASPVDDGYWSHY